MITFDLLKQDEEIKALINAQEKQLKGMGYTEHGTRHLGIVSKRTKQILSKLGCSEQEIFRGQIASYLHDIGRVKYDVISDEEAIDAFFKLSRLEGIIPAIESSHAVAYGMKLAKKMGRGSILINLSGRGDKDMDYIIEKYGKML